MAEGLSLQGPQFFLEDSVNDWLYISGGSNGSVDGVISPGVIRWDGQSFHAMDCGLNWNCTSELAPGGLGNGGVRALAFWDDLLFAAGDIYHISGTIGHNVAHWNGDAWAAVGDGFDGIVNREAIRTVCMLLEHI